MNGRNQGTEGPLISEKKKDSEDEPLKKRIPLPYEGKARGTVHPLRKLAEELRREGLISHENFIEWEQDPFNVERIEALLKAWHANDKAGRRWSRRSAEYPTLVTDKRKFPNLQDPSFRIDNLKLLLQGEQQEMDQFLTEGFMHGFDIMVEQTLESVVYPNKKKMTPEEEAALARGIEQDFEQGFVTKRNGAPGVFIGSPVYTVPKKKLGRKIANKFRRVHNASKGKPGFPAVNEAISRENSTLQYPTVGQAGQRTLWLKRTTGKRVFYSKWDLRQAYRQLPLRPDQYGLLGFVHNGEEYLETRLVFGVRTGCKLMTAVTQTIAWILQFKKSCKRTQCCRTLTTFCRLYRQRVAAMR